MKLLVFAHTPPPHHGQSYMVKLLIEGLGGDQRRRARSEGKHPTPNTQLPTPNGSGPTDLRDGIECYHVNCRYSETIEDIGSFRFEKMWLVVRYSLEAIWCRFRYGIQAFYYVPAPGKRAALYRDWVVMMLCRPFFREIIHHWHAAGLGDWLRREGTWFERWLTHRLLGNPALGIALAVPSMRDALWFRARQVAIVPNGIPDPCPDFETAVLPTRRQRANDRCRLIAEARTEDDVAKVRVLYLAHCTREKGMMDALEGVLIANATLADSGPRLRFHLTVAGEFMKEEEETEFRQRLANPAVAAQVEYAGFVTGAAKDRLLRESDVLCFPTYYPAEGQPVILIEALAFGLPCITTHWRAIPDLLPMALASFVRPRQPDEIGKALIDLASRTDIDFATMRKLFLAHFVSTRHVEALQRALIECDSESRKMAEPSPGDSGQMRESP